MNQNYQHTLDLLKTMLGADKTFRPGQWEAIEMVAIQKRRALVVQRTGWGKSIVYFLVTKLLREEGGGPTVLISPLLSLMRNQIEMAEKIGIQAVTINSANTKEWKPALQKIIDNQCDILLISPERLANQEFREDVLPLLTEKIGLFVVDEAHCISDWGHDFRPDYRRITRVIQNLPKGVPILGTTATANNRVVKDIQQQLGEDLIVQRGSLVRKSLRLQNINLPSRVERLVWILENVQKFPGSGIIYCLTVADVELVSDWLIHNGVNAAAYYADLKDREELEQKLIKNEIKVMVSTVALGMGFDKPDIGFVIHYQRPSSVIAYYQQVGRAGRAVDRSYGILLSGMEDDEIQDYFINSAFPSQRLMKDILWTLENKGACTKNKLLSFVNCTNGTLEKALKLLEVDGAVGIDGREYFRTANRWSPDLNRETLITNQRKFEQQQMRDYLHHTGCLMAFLENALDDENPHACGICSNCKGKGLKADVLEENCIKAQNFVNGRDIILYNRAIVPNKDDLGLANSKIPENCKNQHGRSLSYYGEIGFGKQVECGKYKNNHFDDELVKAAADLIQRWQFNGDTPTWITAIPSQRRPTLVFDFAQRLSVQLGLPFIPVFSRTENAPEQKTMLNSFQQATNVCKSLSVVKQPRPESVLLVDDIFDSGWTMTIAGVLLRNNGSGLVYPFTLAKTAKGFRS